MQLATHSVSSHSSITSCSRQAQLHPTCLPVPQHRLSCKQAVAPNTVARAGSNGNGTSSTKQQQQHISIIASDVDGTLLNSQQQLTPAVEVAVKQAAAAGVPLIVATGKARGPWVPEVLPRLGLTLPGVFLQGLLITDAQGNVLHSRCLPDDVVDSCIQLAAQHDITLTAYCSDRIFCKAIDEHTNRLLWYKEPTPEPVGDLATHLLGSVEAQKLIFMAPQAVIDVVRPGIEAALAGRASCTTALSGMLEVLPLGASKGAGVAWLLDYLGMDPAGMLALGDGENDIEMLQLAAVGVAMGNAGAKVKGVADAVVGSNDEDGVAQAIQQYVLQPRGLATAVPAVAAAAAAAGGDGQ